MVAMAGMVGRLRGGGGRRRKMRGWGMVVWFRAVFFFLGIVWWFLVIADGVGLLIEGNDFFSGCVVEE